MPFTSLGHERTAVSTRRIDPAQQPTAPLEPAAVKPRYDAFDALRGAAMFLVVTLHAAVAYITHDMPSVLWCVRDAPTSSVFDGFCLWAMGISNPLYFTISGFLAVALYDSRGFRGFIDHRVRRLLVPFVIGVVTILPICLYVWMYGWLCSGRCTLREILRLKFHDPVIQHQRFGAGHLWFLEYLIVMVAIYAFARWYLDRHPERTGWLDRLMSAVLNSSWRILLLAAPTAALLWISRQSSGVDAMYDRQISFLIDPIKFFFYGSFFAIGTFLYASRHVLPHIAKMAIPYLSLSVPVFLARMWYIQRDRISTLIGWEAFAMAALGGLFAWLIVFGLIGLALRSYQTPRRSVRYLADSSYWIYLIHMPILGLIQVDLFRVPGSALWKFPLVLTGTLILGFASYQTCVRYTRIGRALHGHRERRSSLTAPISDAKPMSALNSASNRLGRSA